jgi:hypothetical protein
MGTIIKVFLTGVAFFAGIGVGEVANKEINRHYDEYRRGKENPKPTEEKITVEPADDVKVSVTQDDVKVTVIPIDGK